MSKTEKIDFSDIPELTAADWKKMRHVTPLEVEEARKALEKKYGKKIPPRPSRFGGRPPKGLLKYKHVSIRLDPVALAWAREQGERGKIGYQTVINQVLLSVACRVKKAA
jgi:uncharacterized protein (DUF4415 family)